LERERKERERRGIELEESNSINAASGAAREKDGDNAEESASPISVSLDVSGMAAVMADATRLAVAGQTEALAAISALAERREEPAVVNVSVEPHIALDVKSRNGKTTTHVRAYDDKGRILQTETVPEEDDD
jgi:hypothetical protein